MSDRKIVALILTHGRANSVVTYNTLKKCGFTGDIILVLDNEDKSLLEYQKNFKSDEIFIFDKEAESKKFDTADLSTAKRNAIVYARNASFWIAKELGYTHFIQLDDDYTTFVYTGGGNEDLPRVQINNMDKVVSLMCDFIDSTNVKTIAMSQGGDYVGGGRTQAAKNRLTRVRKAMNSFVCRVDRPFSFLGRINEDVNTYTRLGSIGDILLTTPELYLEQKQTQSNSGGMTDIYKAQGTYIKSFYTVIFNPSSVKIGVIGCENPRIHHSIDWNKTIPKIIRESVKNG